MGSLIARLTPELEVWVPVLCSWARHFTLTVVYKWVMENLLRCPCDGLALYPGEYKYSYWLYAVETGITSDLTRMQTLL